MSKAKQTLEMATNIAVIVAVILVAIVLYRYHSGNGVSSPSKGDLLPQLGAYVWNASPHTLVLAVRKGCHFCEESMPFYRKLAELKKEGRLNVSLIAVFPDSAETAQEILHSQNVDIPVTPGINLGDLKVGGTPTVILADGNGRVENYWVGKQDETGEQSILKAIER